MYLMHQEYIEMSNLAEAQMTLVNIDEKIHVLKETVADYENMRIQTIKDIHKFCEHNECIRIRHYYSGMHTAEYEYKCLTCGHEVADSTYYAATKQSKG
jgi:hypothetical protein